MAEVPEEHEGCGGSNRVPKRHLGVGVPCRQACPTPPSSSPPPPAVSAEGRAPPPSRFVALRAAANMRFHKNDYEHAVALYTRALRTLTTHRSPQAQQGQIGNQAGGTVDQAGATAGAFTALSNRAQAHLNLRHYAAAAADAAACVALEPRFAKAHWRHARALERMGRFRAALSAVEQGLAVTACAPMQVRGSGGYGSDGGGRKVGNSGGGGGSEGSEGSEGRSSCRVYEESAICPRLFEARAPAAVQSARLYCVACELEGMRVALRPLADMEALLAGLVPPGAATASEDGQLSAGRDFKRLLALATDDRLVFYTAEAGLSLEVAAAQRHQQQLQAEAEAACRGLRAMALPGVSRFLIPRWPSGCASGDAAGGEDGGGGSYDLPPAEPVDSDAAERGVASDSHPWFALLQSDGDHAVDALLELVCGRVRLLRQPAASKGSGMTERKTGEEEEQRRESGDQAEEGLLELRVRTRGCACLRALLLRSGRRHARPTALRRAHLELGQLFVEAPAPPPLPPASPWPSSLPLLPLPRARQQLHTAAFALLLDLGQRRAVPLLKLALMKQLVDVAALGARRSAALRVVLSASSARPPPGEEDTFGHKLCANCGRRALFRRQFRKCPTCRRAWFCSAFCARFAVDQGGEGGHAEICYARRKSRARQARENELDEMAEEEKEEDERTAQTGWRDTDSESSCTDIDEESEEEGCSAAGTAGNAVHGPSAVALAYGRVFAAGERAGVQALLASGVALMTPRGACDGSAAVLKALLVSRARMASELRMSAPAALSAVSAEVRFSFENKQGVTVTLADAVTVQHDNLVAAIVRRVVTAPG